MPCPSCGAVADGAQQGEERAVEGRRDPVPLASGHDGAGQRLDFERRPGEGVEIHRCPRFRWIGHQRGQDLPGFILGQIMLGRAPEGV
jgi:hypothetical protein